MEFTKSLFDTQRFINYLKLHQIESQQQWVQESQQQGDLLEQMYKIDRFLHLSQHWKMTPYCLNDLLTLLPQIYQD